MAEEFDNKTTDDGYEDVCFISELRHYSNLYNKLLKDVKRSASIINKRLIK